MIAHEWNGIEVVSATVETVKIESDEYGFELHLTDTDGMRFILNVHAVAGALLEQAQSEIGEWYAEGKAAAAEHELERAGADDSGYAPDDPKHPTYHERMTS